MKGEIIYMKYHEDAAVTFVFGNHRVRTESPALPWVRTLAGLFCIFLIFIFMSGVTVRAQGSAETARPSVNGALHVNGTVLTDRNGQEVVLRGLRPMD
jgi:hypothetical protein